ncbi:MAG: phosphomannomutase/phosphoglucomutase, partial [Thermoplasmatales archaeon]
GSATVIADVKCSNVLFQEIQRRGGPPVMWKTGHSLIKAKMKELKAPLAGEMSGHIFVGERYYGFDDAVYVALRLIEIFTREDFDLEVFLRSLPKTFNTPEIRIDVDEGIKFKLVDALKDSFRDYDVNTTDGVRVNFEDGWALVRASNTQPAVIMRFESFSEQGLNRIREMVETLVRKQLDLLA